MGFFSKDIKTMDDLFVHTLRDIYYAEKQIVQSLPEMIEKANDPSSSTVSRRISGRAKTT
jgi:ferritin-like metal-binding protein YciE